MYNYWAYFSVSQKFLFLFHVFASFLFGWLKINKNTVMLRQKFSRWLVDVSNYFKIYGIYYFEKIFIILAVCKEWQTHLRCLGPGQHSFDETSQWWRAVGDAVSETEFMARRTDSDVSASPNGRYLLLLSPKNLNAVIRSWEIELMNHPGMKNTPSICFY